MKQSTIRRTRGHLIWALALTLLASSGMVLAEKGDYPKAEKILDAYVKAVGGLEAYDKIQNRVTHATLNLVAAGITAPIEIYAARPARMYTLVQSDAIGRIEKGTDGETVWEITTMTGPVVKEDPEKTQALKDSAFDRLIYWRDNFKSVETVGVEEIDGTPCYKVVQTPNSGNAETFYYDQESSLLVKYASVVQTQMGSIPIEAVLGDLREVDGLLIPHRTRVTVMGQERVITATSIEHNVDLPASRFELPEAIEAIVAKEPAEAG